MKRITPSKRLKSLFVFLCFAATLFVLLNAPSTAFRKGGNHSTKLIARYRRPIDVDGRALLAAKLEDDGTVNNINTGLHNDPDGGLVTGTRHDDPNTETDFFEKVLNVDTVPIRENTEDFDSIIFTINHPKKCMDSDNQMKDIDLLILVATRVVNADERKLIRETWGNTNFYDGLGVVVLFLVGNPKYTHHEYFHRLVSEDVKHNDIIGGNFEDSYYMLTMKTVMGLKWAQKYCPLAKYVMKCDDDVLIQPYNILRYQMPDYESLIGACGNASVVGHDPGTDDPHWPYETYPAYCSGTAYLISGSLVPRLYATALQTKMFKFEDVFIGFLVYKLNIPVLRHTAFRSSMLADSACKIKDLVVSHHFSNAKYGTSALTVQEYRTLVTRLWWELQMIRKRYQICPSHVSGLGDKPGKLIYNEELARIENHQNYTIT